MSIAVWLLVSTLVRYLAFAITVTGCAFTAPEAVPIIEPGPDPGPQPCRAGEQGVVLCVDFEEPPVAGRVLDSSPIDHVVTAISVLPEPRLPGEHAVVLSTPSSLLVAPSPELDLPELTIEMWIRPDKKPPRKGSGLFDHHDHYTMAIRDNRRIRCGLTGDDQVTSEDAVPDKAWSHVVCRLTGGEMRVYLNGHLSACRQLEPASTAPNLVGSAIGARLAPVLTDRFIGGVDNVRVYSLGLTDEQICAAAGQPAGECAAACPQRDGGDDDDD